MCKMQTPNKTAPTLETSDIHNGLGQHLTSAASTWLSTHCQPIKCGVSVTSIALPMPAHSGLRVGCSQVSWPSSNGRPPPPLRHLIPSSNEMSEEQEKCSLEALPEIRISPVGSWLKDCEVVPPEEGGSEPAVFQSTAMAERFVAWQACLPWPTARKSEHPYTGCHSDSLWSTGWRRARESREPRLGWGGCRPCESISRQDCLSSEIYLTLWGSIP